MKEPHRTKPRWNQPERKIHPNPRGSGWTRLSLGTGAYRRTGT